LYAIHVADAWGSDQVQGQGRWRLGFTGLTRLPGFT
jgi:hypothetical protein